MKRYINDTTILLSGTLLSQITTVVASPFLTRLYTPNDFGILAVYFSILSILSTAGSLQYEKAILLPDDDVSALHLLILSCAILITLSLLTGITCWLWGFKLFAFFKVTELYNYYWLLPLGLLGADLYQILVNWSIRRKAFSSIATTRFMRSISMIFLQLTGGWLNPSPFCLLFGDAASRVFGGSRLSLLVIKKDLKLLHNINSTGIKQVALRYKKFPMLSTFSSLIKELSKQLPTFLLAVFYGPQIVGWYILIQRILGIPLSLIGDSIANVYFGESSRLKNENPRELPILFTKTLKKLFIITLPLAIVISILSPQAIPLVFGKEWSTAGYFLPILSIMYLFQYLAISVSASVYVLERNELHLLRECIGFFLLILAAIFMIKIDLPPLLGIACISAAGSIGFLINIYISWLAVKQVLHSEGDLGIL